MKVLLRTNSTNPDWYGGCECAVVEFTDELIASLKAKCQIAREAHAKDKNLWELYFWDSPATFYDYDAWAALGGDNEAFDSDGFMRLPDALDLEQFDREHQPQRTECNQTIIRCLRMDLPSFESAFEIVFFCYPKHDSVGITTYAMTLKDIEEVLADTAEAKG